ncbi:MAG: DUF983 domain-containing protein [Bacteroidetes bacterium]|nr:DUF983 domain-containing protein [Bacteroidota bacterium]
MSTPGWIQSVAECRCPDCRKGKVFTAGAYHPTKFHQMEKSCGVCGRSFLPEPGFYFGAMYVSYAFTVAIMVGSWLFLKWFVQPEENVYILVFILTVMAVIPLSFRYSRLIWLYWFG